MDNGQIIRDLALILGFNIFGAGGMINNNAINLVLNSFTAYERVLFDKIVKEALDKYGIELDYLLGEGEEVDDIYAIKENNIYLNIKRLNGNANILNSGRGIIGGRNNIKGVSNFSTFVPGDFRYLKESELRKDNLENLINKLKDIYKENMDEYDLDNVIKLRKMIMNHEDFNILSFKDKISSLYGKNNKLKDRKVPSVYRWAITRGN